MPDERAPLVREITVAFADIDGFTRLTDEHGDVAALTMVTHLEEVAACSLVGRTRLIKRVGDAVMLAAPSPDDVVATVLTLRGVLDAVAVERGTNNLGGVNDFALYELVTA